MSACRAPADNGCLLRDLRGPPTFLLLPRTLSNVRKTLMRSALSTCSRHILTAGGRRALSNVAHKVGLSPHPGSEGPNVRLADWDSYLSLCRH